MLTRTTLGLCVVASFVVALAGPAAADPWGNVECEQIPSPSCELGTGDGEDDDRTPFNPDQPDNGGDGTPDSPVRPPDDSLIGEPENLADCEYVPVDYVPPDETPPIIAASLPSAAIQALELVTFAWSTDQAAVVPPPDDDTGGAWYVYRCAGEGVTDALWRPPVWIPDEERPDGTVGPSIVDVARRAYAQLFLPPPQIGVSPAADQLVNLPTWLWLDPHGWAEVSATASVPGVSVTAVATPQLVSWSMGDGGSVTCDGPGTAFTAGDDPAGASPDCGYVYTTSSAQQSDDTYELSATVEWIVTWSGAGQSGVFPGLTTTAARPVRVAESQALNTR